MKNELGFSHYFLLFFFLATEALCFSAPADGLDDGVCILLLSFTRILSQEK